MEVFFLFGDPSKIKIVNYSFAFTFPVAKPLLVDGSAKSHELFIAYDESSLSKLEPPFVVQEFINHGIFSVTEMDEQAIYIVFGTKTASF